MNTYSVWFALSDGINDQHTVRLQDDVFAEWNRIIEAGGTISFFNIKGDLVVINTKFLLGYLARVQE